MYKRKNDKVVRESYDVSSFESKGKQNWKMWLMWVVVVIVIAGLAWWLWNRNNSGEQEFGYEFY